MKTIIFLFFVCFCLGQINLRKQKEVDNFFSSACQLPCLTQKEKIFPGAVLGYPAFQNGMLFNSFSQRQFLQSCCDQQKTYDFLNGLIVPDFTEVKMTNEQDFNDIQVDIQPQKVQGSFEIKIKHTFQRVAFQLEANQHLQANMTSVLSELSQPDQCEYSKDVKNNWYQIWSLIGEQVSTKVFAGAEQIIYITLYIQEEYTTEQVINNYTQLISKNKIQAIGNYFNNIERYNYAVYSTGGVNYYQWTNFSDYLAKLNPSNYIQIIPKDSQKFQESYVDSYKLFEQEQQKVYNCSNQSWNFRFRKTNIQ